MPVYFESSSLFESVFFQIKFQTESWYSCESVLLNQTVIHVNVCESCTQHPTGRHTQIKQGLTRFAPAIPVAGRSLLCPAPVAVGLKQHPFITIIALGAEANIQLLTETQL